MGFSQSAFFFATAAQSDAQGFEKVAFRHLLWHLLGTVAGPWSQGGLEVSIDSLHRDFASAPSTCTAEKHAKGDPQRAVGGRCVASWGLGKTVLWDAGERFAQGKHTFGHRGYFAGPKKQRDLSHVAF